MRVGFIGLGTLGKEIALKIKENGFEIKVYNRTKEKTKGFEAVDSPRDLVSFSDVIFIIVSDSLASKEVIFGENGLAKENLEQKVIFDMTTNHYAYVSEASQKLKELGAYYIDSPLIGSVVPAKKGELIMLASGDKDIIEKFRPIIKSFSKEVIYCGDPPKATIAKLLNNSVLASLMISIASAVRLGEKAGFKKEEIIDILSKGAGSSNLLNVKKEKLLNEDFDTHFSIENIHKDLHYFEDLLKDLKTFSFLGSAAKQTFSLAIKENLSNLDISAIYKIF